MLCNGWLKTKNLKTILSAFRNLYCDKYCMVLRFHYTPKNKLLFIMTCLEAFGRYQNSSFKEPTSEGLSEKGLIPLFSCIICIYKNYIPPHIHIPHIIFTSLIISCSSASEGFCPKDLITVASSWGANIYIHPFSCWFAISLDPLISEA